MHDRCRSPRGVRRYKGRGIAIAKSWHDFQVFLEDMGPRPAGTSIERINNDLGYSKENCKWATRDEQGRNTSTTKLTFEAAVSIAMRRLAGEPYKSIAADFGICEQHACGIAKGHFWKGALEEAARRLQPTNDDQLGQLAFDFS
jgi:hypothetical protein